MKKSVLCFVFLHQNWE